MKILSVDDSFTVRMLIKKALANYECEIVEAANGQEGLDAAIKEKPDLIILDITMPEMDGVQMLEKFREHPSSKSVPVIMLTAEKSQDVVMRIAKAGVQDYIVKPFDKDVLIEKIQKQVELKAIIS